MIPQDPIMFKGTLRYNLDPFNENTDERINELVKKAGLEYILEGTSKQELKDKQAAAKAKAQLCETNSSEEEIEGKEDEEISDENKGLNFKVTSEGSNLSVGERQLICIIRAILRCNKIVILDEATANIDVAEDLPRVICDANVQEAPRVVCKPPGVRHDFRHLVI